MIGLVALALACGLGVGAIELLLARGRALEERRREAFRLPRVKKPPRHRVRSGSYGYTERWW